MLGTGLQTFEERIFVVDWKMQRVLNHICPYCEDKGAKVHEDFIPNHDQVAMDCGTWWLFNRVNPSETVINQSRICKRISELEYANERMVEDLDRLRVWTATVNPCT